MVMNQTEALVAIDINSGKSTREHNIEDTALRTNLEASDEIARQLRLRDLAGLIVVDYIDMEEKRNNRSVERRLKEALKNDRARIQVGRISHFGLLEMSRQRLRPGLLEGSSRTCPHCEGRGIVRSISSCGLSVLRAIEEHLIARKPENLTVKCHPEVASYILNEKRDNLLSIETSYGISVFIVSNAEVKGSQAVIERAGERNIPPRKVVAAPVRMDQAFAADEAEEETVEEAEEASAEATEESSEEPRNDEGRRDDGGRRRRRRGRRGGRRDRPEGGETRSADETPGTGEQPDVGSGDEDGVSEIEGDDASEGVETVGGGEGNDGEARGGEQRERGERGGRGRRGRRDRWGRNRDRERNRDGREPREPRNEPPTAEVHEAHDASPVHEQPMEEPRRAPAPVIQIPVAEEPQEVRKWQPPAPTIVTTERKTGWWSKK
jgi:ribonuclease E